MTNSLILYVIKNEGGVPRGHPILIENFLQTLGDPTLKVTQALVAENGYLPLNQLTKPKDTARHVVQDNGLVIGDDGYVKADYVMVDRAFADTDMEAILAEKLTIVKNAFVVASARPEVLIASLGFSVDGSYDDLRNFEIGKDLGVLSVVDSDGVSHDISIEEYDDIITGIKAKALELMEISWGKKSELKAVDLTLATALATIDEITVVGLFGENVS
jgi:hypothetical protein